MKKKIAIIILCVFTFLLNITPASAETFTMGTSGVPITIDGYYDDWSDKPLSYHYNWDNSENCWKWGVWIDGVCYKTPEGTYDNNVRHIIQLYSDGTNIYGHIKISRQYGAKFNGEDYQFTFNNGQQASFQITDVNGQVITNEVKNFTPGIHSVQVRHRNGSCSYQIAENSQAKLTVYDDYLFTEVEFSIPLNTCVIQNRNIDLENLEVITFFTPNLMYQKIEIHGTPILIFSILIGGTIAVVAQKNINSKRSS